MADPKELVPLDASLESAVLRLLVLDRLLNTLANDRTRVWTYDARSAQLEGTRLSILSMGMLDPQVTLASAPAVLSADRALPTSILIPRPLSNLRNLRRLAGAGLEPASDDRRHFLGAPLANFTLSSRQQVIGLAVVQEMPPRELSNVPTLPLTPPLCSPYVASPPPKHPPRVGTTWSHALVNLPVTVPWVLSENYKRGPLFLMVFITRVVEMEITAPSRPPAV